ncbi:peptide/nickel transport system ATP-binding protein [Thermomonospora echinospora]|uniref:Peptide/nickel transport system ATP-binding protein n=1 Tax=Thermomonospora echinospora TaxID=1992 RepID=A0A1H6BK32_9ACTN|nr:ABC transporter ATP-binding protein [Thermomonospora echinospora]SEG61034.1 peptide/nickel transport system ATP-binding protein [Thermomonospora echinospora]
MTVLEVRDLRVTFRNGTVPAVRGISLAVGRGEVLGIVGESGCGKSATALALTGLLPPGARATGSVRLRGRELIGLTDAELARVRGRDIAMVFQDPMSALTPVRPVGDQIAETVQIHQGAGRTAARARAVELLDLVGVPDPARRARAYPHELSGGMRQRVMIAMAVANDPAVIVADEPTTALDGTVQARVLRVLRAARDATGAAIVLITHDLGVAAGLADRVMVMYAGRAVETGPVDEVYARPRMPYTIGLLQSVPRLDGRPPFAPAEDTADRPRLVPIEGHPPVPGRLPGGCPFAPRCPVAEPRCREAEPDLRPVGADGRAVACVRDIRDPAGVYPRPVPPPPAVPVPSDRRWRRPVLEVSGLTRHHPLYTGGRLRRRTGTVRAVDGIEFDIREGETLGLVGESGGGKTTALMEILRLRAPQAGRIAVLGQDTATLTAARRKALRRDVQVVFQDPLASLDPRMRVADILAEPLTAHGARRRAAAGRVGELLALVGLGAELAGRYPGNLSGGQRQRVAIARALATEPRLVLLDEPVSALDVSVQAGVLNLLEDLKARLGLAYLLVAHDLAVVRHVADRVAVMYLGRIVELGEVPQVYHRPAHPYTRALLSAVPVPDPPRERRRRSVALPGDRPDPADPPAGCRFRTRCPRHAALDPVRARRCLQVDPEPVRVGDDQLTACHYPEAMTP